MNTKHTCCEPGRGPGFVRTPGCPRCDELKGGAKARSTKGWDRFSKAKRDDSARTAAIRAHDFRACEAKHVCCTCFDW